MDPSENSDGGAGQFRSTPFGSDEPANTHVQPAPSLPAQGGGLPGEQKDPRYC